MTNMTSVGDKVRVAVEGAAARVLGEPDTETIDRFWSHTDVNRHLTGRDFTDSQLAALRELATSGIDADGIDRFFKKAGRRQSQHRVWQKPVSIDGKQPHFSDAMRSLVVDLTGPRFDERVEAVEAALGRAADRAGVEPPRLGSAVAQMRVASLGASLSYLVRLAQKERNRR